MSLLHPAILYGLGLMTLPVILHLLLKQKPKKLLFPALQLIANRRKQNVSRMRLRHFWLLLLRMLVIGLLVFAIARPSVPAADYSMNLREILTAVLLIGVAAGSYAVFSRRWRSAHVPRHERKFRQSRLRTGLILATIVLLLLTVAWPYQKRIAAELRSPTPAGDVSLPVAAIFVFDTSLSMTYQQEGKTRLDVAREVAIEHLGDLPNGSRVAIADVSNDNPILFQTTIAGAKTRIEGLEVQPISLPVNDRIRAALRLHEDDRDRTLAEQANVADQERKDRFLRRIYVLTDLARTAFRVDGTTRLAAELEEQAHVNLFLVDVSQENPLNIALIDVEPSRARLSGSRTLSLRTTLARTMGPNRVTDDLPLAGSLEDSSSKTRSPDSFAVELRLLDGRGTPIKVDQQMVTLDDETPQEVVFPSVSPEAGPIVHGEVRIVSSDPLPFDDTRHFTIELRSPTKVLVIAPTPAQAEDWTLALEVNGYDVAVRGPADLPQEELSEYPVVCLLNVPELSDDTWYRLGQFVSQGGGLAIFLGSTDVRYAVNYARDEALVFLPGQPRVHSAPGVSFLNIENEQHPLFKPLQENDGIALLEAADIDRFWRVDPAADTTVLARYTEPDRAPALLERIHGRGRTLMLTTAVDVKGFGRNWNILASPQRPVWTFLALTDEMIRYLSHASETRLTYDAGETPVIMIDAVSEPRELLLQHPGFRQSRVAVPADETVISIDNASQIGHYDLKTTGERPAVVGGFSVNARPSESNLGRITPDELDEMFGDERYQVARSIGELKESINIADLGRELFPLLLSALAILFLVEHFVANWFYDEERAADARVRWNTTAPESAAAATAGTAAP